ncbi:MAG: SRPBCC domain-containing protein [Vicinamibacteraceae bacterium]
MQKLKFSIEINAPKEKAWNTMLDDETYRTWTEAFMAGSHYVGDWNKGSEILFLAPDEKGKLSGMVSRIKENRPYEYVSIEHLGFVEDGKKDTTSDAVRAWAGALENYTFRETNKGTEVVVEMDTNEEHAAMFQDTWPKALQKLKTLAEG